MHTKLIRFYAFIVGLALLLTSGVAAGAQNDVRLFLGEPDLRDFPSVRLLVRAADAQGIPPAGLGVVRLSENGAPVPDFTQATIPVGVDVVFVIDGSDAAQVETARASIGRFTGQFMSRAGQDRLSVVAPDGSGGTQLLLDGETDPDAAAAVLAAAEFATEPAALTRMVTAALTQLRRQAQNNRFQAVMIFSDGGQLAGLNVDGVARTAGLRDVALFTALLELPPTTAALDAAARLAQPTRGSVARMNDAAGADPVYLIWQRQANQTQITYQSRLQESGRFPLAVEAAGTSATTEINLTLLPAAVQVDLGEAVIRRVGDAPDALLADLQPATWPLTVTVRWPDGLPRSLVEVALEVDGRSQPPAAVPPDLQADPLALRWDVRSRGTGGYEVVVAVTDDLGLTGRSAPQLVTILTERPQPAAPTPLAVTATPPLVVRPPLDLSRVPPPFLLAGAALLLGVALLIGLSWRRRAPARPSAAAPRSEGRTPPQPETAVSPLRLVPVGEGEPLLLDRAAATIGRGPEATLTLAHPSVAPLHARLRWRDGRFWLWDESGAAGTYLNHRRLGLAPQPLQEGDLVQIGRFAFRVQAGRQAEGADLPPMEEEEPLDE